MNKINRFNYPRLKVPLDYIKILSRYPDFKATWEAYRYWKTVANTELYQFDIYKRYEVRS